MPFLAGFLVASSALVGWWCFRLSPFSGQSRPPVRDLRRVRLLQASLTRRKGSSLELLVGGGTLLGFQEIRLHLEPVSGRACVPFSGLGSRGQHTTILFLPGRAPHTTRNSTQVDWSAVPLCLSLSSSLASMQWKVGGRGRQASVGFQLIAISARLGGGLSRKLGASARRHHPPPSGLLRPSRRW